MSGERCLAVPAEAIGAKSELDTELRQLVSKRLEAVGLLDTKVSYSREREGFTSTDECSDDGRDEIGAVIHMCCEVRVLGFLCGMGDAYPYFGLIRLDTQLLKELYKIGRVPLQGGERDSRELDGRAYGQEAEECIRIGCCTPIGFVALIKRRCTAAILFLLSSIAEETAGRFLPDEALLSELGYGHQCIGTGGKAIVPCVDLKACGKCWRKKEEGTQILRAGRSIQLTALPGEGAGLDE